MRFHTHILFGALAACRPNLKVPDQTVISCQNDSECPPAFRCRVGQQRCISLQANERPTVVISPIARAQGTIEATLLVIDAQGDTSSLQARLITAAGSTEVPAPSDIAATANGTTVTLSIDAASVLGTAYRNDVTLAVTASDAGGAGDEITSASFAYGNDPAVLSALSLVPTPVRGSTIVSFAVTDSAADSVSVDAMELSLSGAFDDVVPIMGTDMANFPAGGLAELATDPLVPRPHVFIWDSLVGAPLSAPHAKLRLRVTDSAGGVSTIESNAFAIANQTAPRIEGVRSFTATEGVTAGLVGIDYRTVDEESDAVDVRVEYSDDGGLHWIPCTEAPQTDSSGRYDLRTTPTVSGGESGVSHRFYWAATDDLFTTRAAIAIRVTASDGAIGAPTEAELAQPIGIGPELRAFAGTKFGSGTPSRTVAADINDDGVADVAVLNTGGVDFWKSTPNNPTSSRFSLAFSCALGSLGGMLQQVVVADLDGTPPLDVIVLGPTGVAVLLGTDASGSSCATHFATAVVLSLGQTNTAATMAAYDADDDGDIDVFVAEQTSPGGASTLQRFENDGHGNFSTQEHPVFASTGNILAMTVADLDCTGRGNLVVGVGSDIFWRHDDGTLATLAPTGGAAFLAASPASGCATVAVGDGLNRIDIIDGTPSGPLLRNQPFSPTGGLIQDLVWTRINADAAPDLVVLTYTTAQHFDVYFGHPGSKLLTHAYADLVTLPNASSVSGASSGDFNADGLGEVTFATELGFALYAADTHALSSVSFAPPITIPLISTPFDAIPFAGEEGIGAVIRRRLGADLIVRDATHGVTSFVKSLDLTAVVTGMTTCDYSGNGALDVVFTHETALGSGSFELVRVPHVEAAQSEEVIANIGTTEPTVLRCLDFDGDGRADILTGHDGLLTLRTHDALGLVAHDTVVPGSDTLIDVLAADIDLDGQPDLVVQTNPSEDHLALFHNAGNGNFSAPSSLDCEANPHRIHPFVADISGDGLPDILAVYEGPGPSMHTCLQKSVRGAGLTPVLASSITVTTPTIETPALVDVNDDGTPDIVTMSWVAQLGPSGPVGGIDLLNPTAPEIRNAHAFDWNGDHTLDVVQVTRLPNTFLLRQGLDLSPFRPWSQTLTEGNSIGVAASGNDRFGATRTAAMSVRPIADATAAITAAALAAGLGTRIPVSRPYRVVSNIPLGLPARAVTVTLPVRTSEQPLTATVAVFTWTAAEGLSPVPAAQIASTGTRISVVLDRWADVQAFRTAP